LSAAFSAEHDALKLSAFGRGWCEVPAAVACVHSVSANKMTGGNNRALQKQHSADRIYLRQVSASGGISSSWIMPKYPAAVYSLLTGCLVVVDCWETV
jgi:hypothetical protein